jgi:hypothetical protein
MMLSYIRIEQYRNVYRQGCIKNQYIHDNLRYLVMYWRCIECVKKELLFLIQIS